MIIFYEIRKISSNRIFKITALALCFACALFSYFTSTGSGSESLTAGQIQESYDRQMQIYIGNAERGLRELDGLGKENDYSHDYYETVIELYTKASDGKTIKNGSAVGWDELLSSDSVLLFSLAAAIVAGGVCVFEEKRTGSISVIFAAKNGRSKTAAAKALSVATLSVSFCVLFTALAAAVFFVNGRLSSGLAEVQTAESFRFSPYNITLWQCFAAVTCGRMLVSALFGVLSAIFSELFYSYALILTSALIPAAAEYMIYKIKFTGVDVFVKNVNIFSFGGPYLLQRYYSVRFFGCADAAAVNLLLTVILTAAAFFIFIALFCIRTKQIRTREVKKPLIKIKDSPGLIPKTLSGWEIKKNLLNFNVILIITACVALYCAVSAGKYGGGINTDGRIYRDYCLEYEKMPLDKALAAIAAEAERIETGKGLRDEAIRKFDGGEISAEEFSEIMDEYGYCKAHESGLKRCIERASYLSGSEAPVKHELRFVYDTTLNEILGGDISFLLIVVMIICFSAVFSREYESGAYHIIRTCKNGKSKTFKAKLLFAAAVTALFFTLFTSVDAAVCAFNGAFSAVGASVFSLEAAKNVSADISIGEYLLIMCSMRFAYYELFALILASLSEITKRTMTAAACASVIVFAPYIAAKVGGVPAAVDISAFLSANRVLLSADTSAADFIVLPLFSLFLLAAAHIGFTGKEAGIKRCVNQFFQR